MADERDYRVGVAILRLDGLFQDDFRQALLSSWTAGATITRYRRRWNLSRPHQETREFIVGRIGFVGESEVSSVTFDYDVGDFVREGVPAGVLVPFGVRFSDGLVVYQIRPGAVTEESFTGALASLLNSAANEFAWSVEAALINRSWEDWRKQVEAVTSFNFRLDKPNPHYADDFRIKNLIENINLEYARLAGKAREGEGINTDDDLFRQAIDHVLRDYGRATVEGVTPEGRETIWLKIKGLSASVIVRQTIRSVGGDEIPEDVLVGVLMEQPSSSASIDLRDYRPD